MNPCVCACADHGFLSGLLLILSHLLLKDSIFRCHVLSLYVASKQCSIGILSFTLTSETVGNKCQIHFVIYLWHQWMPLLISVNILRIRFTMLLQNTIHIKMLSQTIINNHLHLRKCYAFYCMPKTSLSTAFSDISTWTLRTTFQAYFIHVYRKKHMHKHASANDCVNCCLAFVLNGLQ